MCTGPKSSTSSLEGNEPGRRVELEGNGCAAASFGLAANGIGAVDGSALGSGAGLGLALSLGGGFGALVVVVITKGLPPKLVMIAVTTMRSMPYAVARRHQPAQSFVTTVVVPGAGSAGGSSLRSRKNHSSAAA